MKTLLNLLACVVVFTVAAFVGNAFGFFKIPALDNARNYGSSVVVWAKGGFKGSPTSPAATATLPDAVPALSQAQAEMAHMVQESQRRAVAKYPDLAVSNTEMNSRFVFRYNWMRKENNPRLQEATWPEILADECAEASKVRVGSKSGGAKGAAGSKKLAATNVQ